MAYAYPHDLARFLLDRWANDRSFAEPYGVAESGSVEPLPDEHVLERLLSTCYQASLLREEERPVRFRLILREPERFNPDHGPPSGLHRLIFTQPRPLSEHELRRLSPAADFYHSLMGVSLDEGNELRIWGLVHSGPYWIQAIQGQRRTFLPLPASLVVSATGPGLITVAKGSLTIGKLVRGRLTSPSTGVFGARWLHETFAANREELFELHEAARASAETPWATLHRTFPGMIIQRMARQVISTIRNSHHGGTLVFLPQEYWTKSASYSRYMSIKYAFTEEEPRQRVRTLVLRYMNALAEACGRTQDPDRPIGWHEYMGCDPATFSHLDEAIVDLANLVARLAAVDGAVILTNRMELMGFGGEILGELGAVPTVARALDPEAEQTRPVSTEGVGTRHRSVYRLCNAVHDATAVVISQDGGVQFVKWKDGAVVYWDQVATSDLDV